MANYTHESKHYQKRWKALGGGRFNGAYYYSREIVKNIIPNVKTDRPWITVNVPEAGAEDRAIVFIHNNKHPENYEWLRDYNDLVLICGVPETVEKVKHLGTAIYIPLSVDVAEVEAYKIPEEEEKKDQEAYFGRLRKRTAMVPADAHTFSGIQREDMLRFMAKYKKIYAVGRTAIEARILGAEVLPYDPRFPDPNFWEVIDNKDAAKLIQKELDKIDKKKKTKKKTEAPKEEAPEKPKKKKSGGSKKKVVKEE